LDLVAHLKIFQMFLISGHVALLRNCFRSVIERPLKDDRGHIYTTHSVKEGRNILNAIQKGGKSERN
jgi:hypothetical protein